MNLKNGAITVREILRVPEAKAILYRELPQLMRSPLVKMAGGMRLSQVLGHAKGHVPPEKVESILNQLKAL